MKNRKKRRNIFTFALVVLLLGSAPFTLTLSATDVSALPAYTVLYCNASEWATLRSIASRSGNDLAHISSREAVTYLDEIGEFYKVGYQGMTGYVLKDFFSTDPAAPLNYGTGSTSSSYSYSSPSYSVAHFMIYCIASEWVTLRSYASREAPALDYIYTGESAEWLATEGEFYKVSAKGRIGYVLAEFFSVDPNAPRNFSSGNAPSSSYSSYASSVLYCRASEYVTLRSYASRNAPALGYVYTGQAVTYLGQSGEFYYVSFNGTTGYVLGSYFSSSPNAPLNYGTN